MRFELLKDDAQGSLRFNVEFNPESLKLKETIFGLVLELEGATTSGEPGGPALPAKTVRVALPPFTKAASVEAKSGRPRTVHEGPVFIAPVQLPRPGVLNNDEKDDSYDSKYRPKNPRIKRSSLRPETERLAEPLPPPQVVVPRPELYEQALASPLVHLIATELHGLTPIAVVQINPVRVTDKGELVLHSNIEVQVNYVASASRAGVSDDVQGELDSLNLTPRTITSRAQAVRSMELARFQVINPDAVVDIARFWPLALGDADYLVITDNRQWNATTITAEGPLGGDLVSQFQRLADWKAMRGLRTRVVTVTDIVAGRFGNFRSGARDLQEVIRNFLKWAHQEWGVAWVLIGGDINIVPVRLVAGASEGGMGRATNDPPNDNQSFWTGSFLKMHVVGPGTWFSNSTDNKLVRLDNGLLVPYDPAGTSTATTRGWHFCTNNSYNTLSAAPTEFVRVNGPAAEVNADFQWLYKWNTIPTDLYYSSLFSLADALPGFFGGRKDWDFNNNGVYGQHNNDTEFDFAVYQTDVSVGRAPVSTAAQAEAWVNKVIAYEQFRRPDGSALNPNWPRRMVFAADNWGGRIGIGPGTSNPPGDNQYFHPSGQAHTLIRLQAVPTDLLWQLIAQVTEPDVRLLPYTRDASATIRGWHYAVSAINLAPSEIVIALPFITFRFPVPTNWVVVFGSTSELTPQVYILDRDELDGSIADQEQLRRQVATELPRIDQISRYYSDELDLSPADAAAAPLQHLTEADLLNAFDAGPHFVSLSGHGWWGGCCGLGFNTANNSNNGFHTFIGYADSCLTNDFEEDDAVSEALLYNPNGGAVAYIGSTRFSWIGVGDNFQRAFFRRLTSTRHLGLVADSRTALLNEATGFWKLYNKWVIFSLNLVGDPEMPVWNGRPATMQVTHAPRLDKRQPFVVEVKRQLLIFEIPLVGAAVSIRQGTFSRVAFTDASGRASFDIHPANLGNLDVTVTAINFLPYFGTAEIVGPVWVAGTVTEIFHQEGNPQQTLVRLRLADGTTPAYYARKSKADYGVILDAVTDAYVSSQEIALEVDNRYSGQGVIERFRFRTSGLSRVVLETNVLAENAQPTEAERIVATGDGINVSE